MNLDKRFSSSLGIDTPPPLSDVLHYAVYKTEHFCYWLLALEEQREETTWYLYASSLHKGLPTDVIEQVLGVFDTCGQLSFFLDLHEVNELKVPALKVNHKNARIYADEMGVLHYPQYAGVYRVGFKSYTVDISPDNQKLRIVHYLQSYKTQYLGVFTEKDACLAVYSHFDARIRGCAMC